MKQFILSIILLGITGFPWDGIYSTQYTFAPTACAPTATKTVLILGNSITYHPPHGDWQGDWGMAASVASHDYVHLLGQRLADNLCATVEVTAAAVWLYEWYYPTFDVSLLDPFRHPDLLIVRLGDNVPEDDRIDSFYENVRGMIAYVGAAETLTTSTYYPRPTVSRSLNALPFPHVDIAHLWDMPETHAGAANATIPQMIGDHPGDLGMAMIADALFVPSFGALGGTVVYLPIMPTS